MVQAELKRAVKLLGKAELGLLEDIYNKLEGKPPCLQRARYRADHSNQIELLDYLEQESLLKMDDRREYYWVSVYAIPLLNHNKAVSVVKLMGDMYTRLQRIYNERLTERVSIEEIMNAVHSDEQETKQALSYISQAHNIHTNISKDFPYQADSSIVISERVLQYAKFTDIIAEYWGWRLNKSNSIKPNRLYVIWSFFKNLGWREIFVGVMVAVIGAALMRYLFGA